MLWWTPLALAAPLTGSLFGSDFTSGGAVGVVSKGQPAVLQVMFTDVGLSCAEALALDDDDEAFKAKKPTLVSLSYRWPAEGAAPEMVMVAGPAGYGRLAGSQQLTTLPGAKGGTGVITFDPQGLEADEMTFVVKSTASFELCTDLPARPDLSKTSFADTTLELAEGRRVTVAVPQGWTQGKGPFGDPKWTAPDGKTALSLGAEGALLPFGEQAAESADNQVDNFSGDGMSSEHVRREEVPGAYVSHWRHRSGFAAWTHQLDVYRQDEGGAFLLKCSIEGDAVAAEQVFAAVQKACGGARF